MHGSLHNKQRTTPSAINYATVDRPNCWSHSISHRSQNQILVENHNFCPFHLHLMPPLWKFLPKYCHNVWHGKMRMVWLHDGKKILKIQFTCFDRIHELSQCHCHILSPTKLNGGLSRLHSADEDSVSRLTSYGSWNAHEKKKTEYKNLADTQTDRHCKWRHRPPYAQQHTAKKHPITGIWVSINLKYTEKNIAFNRITLAAINGRKDYPRLVSEPPCLLLWAARSNGHSVYVYSRSVKSKHWSIRL